MALFRGAHISQNGGRKLYIFPTCLGNKLFTYPHFTRVSWFNYLDGYCLAVDDPFRDPSVDPEGGRGATYFFGSKDVYCLSLLAPMILELAKKLSVSPNNIVIVGSSNGGFAAIRLASLIGNDCLAIALNPILSIVDREKIGSGVGFAHRFKISLDDICFCKRLSVLDDLLNSKNFKFVVFSNPRSSFDIRVTKSLFDLIGVKRQYGEGEYLKIREGGYFINTPFYRGDNYPEPVHSIFLQTESILLVSWFMLQVNRERSTTFCIDEADFMLMLRSHIGRLQSIVKLKEQIFLDTSKEHN